MLPLFRKRFDKNNLCGDCQTKVHLGDIESIVKLALLGIFRNDEY